MGTAAAEAPGVLMGTRIVALPVRLARSLWARRERAPVPRIMRYRLTRPIGNGTLRTAW